MVPIIKFFEWKYRWFVPVIVASCVNFLGVLYLVFKKNELLDTTLEGLAYKLLSVEIRLTTSATVFVVTNLLVLVCVIKMIMDIWANERKFPISAL